MASLFITKKDLGFEKTAFLRLGNDIDKWEDMIVQYFANQYPDLSDANLRLEISEKDPDTLSAVGQLFVENKIAVPIVIKEGELAPLDLFYSDGKLKPLNTTNLLREVQLTDAGTVLDPRKAGDSGYSNFSDFTSLARGMNVFASALNYSNKDAVKAASVMDANTLKYACINNPIYASVLGRFSQGNSVVEKTAAKYKRITKFEPKVAAVPIEKGFCEANLTHKKVAGVVPDHVIDMTGKITGRHLFLSLDGSTHSISNTPIYGFPADGGVTKFASANSGYGSFVTLRHNNFIATVPVRITSIIETPVEKIAAVSDSMGNSWKIRQSPDIEAHFCEGNNVYLSPDWFFWPAGEHEKTAESEMDAPYIKICRNGSFMWSSDIPELLEAVPLEKGAEILAGRYNRQDLSKIASHLDNYNYVLVVEEEDESRETLYNRLLEKTAEIVKEAAKKIGFRPINLWKEASQFNVTAPYTNMFKTAMVKTSRFGLSGNLNKIAFNVNPEDAVQTIDSMLGLNFVTPETINKFLSHQNTLIRARDLCATLLLAARLGLQVDESAIKSAMFALDRVNDDLEQLKAVNLV